MIGRIFQHALELQFFRDKLPIYLLPGMLETAWPHRINSISFDAMARPPLLDKLIE
jgi:hypothetical protein